MSTEIADPINEDTEIALQQIDLEPALRIPKTFHHVIHIYLKDSNAYGNTYFSRYLEWQGVCREKWFHDCLFSNMFQMPGMFLTKVAHQNYFHETYPFQKVDCYLNTSQIKPCSLNLLFRFCVDGVLVSSGYQKVVYVNKEKQIARMPTEIDVRVKEFEICSTISEAAHLRRAGINSGEAAVKELFEV